MNFRVQPYAREVNGQLYAICERTRLRWRVKFSPYGGFCVEPKQ